MNKVKTLTLNSPLFPEQLKHIAEPPRQLYYLGDLENILTKPRLAIVGSRKVSAYGKSVTLKLAREAAEQGIAIVSGLALGIDGMAHQAALEAGGVTLAVLPAGLDKIYPATHRQLAEDILKQGGALITEFPFGSQPFKTNFLIRNRIISGISDAVLIPEAAIRSGSLNTARHALEQGRDVMAVPGNITSELSGGTNNLIKLGATPVTEIRDILAAMGLKQAGKKAIPMGTTPEESIVIELLARGISDSSELLHRSELTPTIFNQTLTMLEITGKVRPLGAGHWALT
jgi:DNA processing protein